MGLSAQPETPSARARDAMCTQDTTDGLRETGHPIAAIVMEEGDECLQELYVLGHRHTG